MKPQKVVKYYHYFHYYLEADAMHCSSILWWNHCFSRAYFNAIYSTLRYALSLSEPPTRSCCFRNCMAFVILHIPYADEHEPLATHEKGRRKEEKCRAHLHKRILRSDSWYPTKTLFILNISSHLLKCAWQEETLKNLWEQVATGENCAAREYCWLTCVILFFSSHFLRRAMYHHSSPTHWLLEVM